MIKKINYVLFSLVLLVASLMSLIVQAETSNPDLYFVSLYFTDFKTNLETLKKSGNAYKMYLLVNKNKYANLTNDQKKRFDSIFQLNKFNFQEMKSIIDKVKKDYPNSRVHIISNDEDSLGLVANLRELYQTNEPEYKTVNLFLNKIDMKEFVMKNTKLSVPKHIHYNGKEYSNNPEKYINYVIAKLRFPIFAKPINDAGSHLTEKIQNKERLDEWMHEHKNANNFELDEFIAGDLYHCDTLVQNGKIIFEKVGKYHLPCFDFLKQQALGSIILLDSDNDALKIKAFSQEILTKIPNLPNGAFHMEMFKKQNGELVFLEMAARTPGAYVPKTYSKNFNFSMEEAHFKLQMGLPCKETCEIKNGPHAAWVWFPMRKGMVKELNTPNIKSKYEMNWKVKVGENLTNPIELKDRALEVLLWNDNYKELVDDFNYLTTFVPYSVSQ